MSAFIELAVGEAPGQVSLAQADTIAEVAQDVGAAGIRLVDNGSELDPSIVGGYLAGRYPDLAYVIDAPTTLNAPYNLARRVLAFDRSTAGRVGIALRTGGGDETSAAVQPAAGADDPANRWSEYATILTELWESFPRSALLGDQAAAIVVDEQLIHPIDFDGRYYRVRGPLDGPASVQGRPVLFATDPAELGWARIARVADAVIIDQADISIAAQALSDHLGTVGRHREDVALVVRVEGSRSDLRAWAKNNEGARAVLAPRCSAAEIVQTVREVVPLLPSPAASTLRSALGLRDLAEVNA